MKQLKISRIFPFFLLFLMFGAWICTTPSKAKTVKGVKLNLSQNITKYDLDGDGEKDVIRIDGDSVDIEPKTPWSITINGKTVYKERNDWTSWLTVTYYAVSADRIYFDIEENADTNDDILNHAFYLYQNGTLKKVCDFYTPIIKNLYYMHYGVTITKMTPQKLELTCTNQFVATAHLHWKMIYKYKKGKWKLSGNTYAVTGGIKTNSGTKYWTLKKKTLTTYKKAGGKKKAFVLKKGAKVKIKKLCLKNKATYMQVTTKKGKTGWFKSPQKMSDWSSPGYFKEAVFAG